MKFPLWLHGHIVVEFRVVSSHPKKSVGETKIKSCNLPSLLPSISKLCSKTFVPR